MATQKSEGGEKALAPRDPFAMLRRFSTEFDRLFDEPWTFRWPAIRVPAIAEGAWLPNVDVFERDSTLVTRMDLPGLKKEDVKVEVSEGRLIISGERKSESEEKKDTFYRSERQFGSFYRAVPLPAGVTGDDVKATFGDGVLEVSVPLPQKASIKTQKVAIGEPKAVKAA